MQCMQCGVLIALNLLDSQEFHALLATLNDAFGTNDKRRRQVDLWGERFVYPALIFFCHSCDVQCFVLMSDCLFSKIYVEIEIHMT